jgi:sorbitol-specific phosphotransferase system component IIC
MPAPAWRAANRAVLAGALVVLLLLPGGPPIRGTPPGASFASRIAQLSEPPGYFDTDNLISNEKSYLHVIPALQRRGVRGGAYIGVGPDQNFSYIAQVKPAIAFIVDVRRDNLLLHLLFKALFELSRTRVEYLALLVGKPAPAHPEQWRDATVERLVSYMDEAKASAGAIDTARTRADAVIARFGLPLSRQDAATIDRFHRSFTSAGLALQFQSTGRSPRDYDPTYRELLLESDRQGHRWNYLASESDFQFVRSLQQRDLIVPVVGNLNGPMALRAIGHLMGERGDRLSAFYASNVEFYLFGDGTFPRFVQNLAHLPHTARSVVIRSIFGRFVPGDSSPGYYSTSVVQPVDDLIERFSRGEYWNYGNLTTPR